MFCNLQEKKVGGGIGLLKDFPERLAFQKLWPGNTIASVPLLECA